MKLIALAVLAALTATTIPGSQLLAASPDSTVVAPEPTTAEAAWSRYRDALQQQREELLKADFAKDPTLRAQALYYLQSLEALTFNLYVAPRQQYPALYTQFIYMPFETSFGFPNPDFLYHAGFIDGAHTYRIYGNKHNGFWSTLQVMQGMWGDESQATLANVDFDDIPSKPNGDFEIFLGPNPPAKPDGKYWVKLDPNYHNSYVNLREVFYDWKKTQPIAVHIETLDRDVDAPMNFDDKELAARLERSRKFVVYNINYVLSHFKTGGATPGAPPERNKFISVQDAVKTGGNPLACYGTLLYDIKPDEALIIQSAPSTARYWGIQMGSVWSQTSDYSYHKSSINGAQARLDSDGQFRAVIALRDPGVPNWLDPVGVGTGFAGFRWYKGPGCAATTITKVKLKDVRRSLPKDTPVVTAEQRREELQARSVDSLRRYDQ